MIIAIEGVEATGKSTVARVLAGGLPHGASQRTPSVYRALRTAGKWDEDELREWRACGVPANTFVEDVFAMDMIAKTRLSNLILDRSLPSGMVYDDRAWTSPGKLTTYSTKLLAWWSSRLLEAKGVLVYLHGDPEYLSGELEDHGRHIQPSALQERMDRFEACFKVCEGSGLAVDRYDSSVEDFDSVASRIAVKHAGGFQQRLGRGWASWT